MEGIRPLESPTVALIVIAWNEAEALRRVLPDIPPGVAQEVIVVDGGSTDGTAEVAVAHGAHVVTQARRGYGAAGLAGAQAATSDVLVYMDGDYADDPTELPRVLAPLLSGRADLVIGSRDGPGSDAGAHPAHQRAGNALAMLLLRALYGTRLRDAGSMRAIRRDALIRLGMTDMTYGWPLEMIVRAAREGYRVEGVPVRYRRRIGVSKVGGTMRGSLRAGYRMLAVIVKHALPRRAAARPIQGHD